MTFYLLVACDIAIATRNIYKKRTTTLYTHTRTFINTSWLKLYISEYWSIFLFIFLEIFRTLSQKCKTSQRFPARSCDVNWVGSMFSRSLDTLRSSPTLFIPSKPSVARRAQNKRAACHHTSSATNQILTDSLEKDEADHSQEWVPVKLGCSAIPAETLSEV